MLRRKIPDRRPSIDFAWGDSLDLDSERKVKAPVPQGPGISIEKHPIESSGK
jgi:hypothetical protein